MNKIWKWIIPVFSVVAFAACEDPITVDVKSGEPKLVIDAFVNNLNEPQRIRLTQSNPYFAKPGTEPPVSGATVVLIDTTDFNNPRLFLFADSGNGNYVWKPNPAAGDTFTVGRTYALVVIEGGDTIIGFSKMNPTARIDSLNVVVEPGDNGRFVPGKYVELAANDLPGTGNTYWIKTWYNDTFRNGISDMNLAYDQAGSPNSSQDGGIFIWPIRYAGINDFGKPYRDGDVVRVEIHSITPETFYWLNLIRNENQNGGLFATPPSNIGTNMFPLNPAKKRGLAGFFCMSATSRAVITVK